MPADNCALCDEPFEDGDKVTSMPFHTLEFTGVRNVHNECVLRSVMGGIGHHEDHVKWCIQAGDPDGGRTRRQSAREVAALIREKGIVSVLETD